MGTVEEASDSLNGTLGRRLSPGRVARGSTSVPMTGERSTGRHGRHAVSGGRTTTATGGSAPREGPLSSAEGVGVPRSDPTKEGSTMRACVMREHRLVVDETADPRPEPGQMLVRILACGICGSDLHFLRHADAMVAMTDEMLPSMGSPAAWSPPRSTCRATSSWATSSVARSSSSVPTRWARHPGPSSCRSPSCWLDGRATARLQQRLSRRLRRVRCC